MGTAAVDVPEEFAFPFEPYDIQVGFMQQLYRTLELGKIGIFESPTGTVSTLYFCLFVVSTCCVYGYQIRRKAR